jgi:hypothetical protein
MFERIVYLKSLDFYGFSGKFRYSYDVLNNITTVLIPVLLNSSHVTSVIDIKYFKFNGHGSVHCNNILIYIQQDATLHSLFLLETALHVSGGTSTHHQ